MSHYKGICILWLAAHVCMAAIYLPCEETDNEYESYCDCWNPQDPILICTSQGLNSIPSPAKARVLNLDDNKITGIPAKVFPSGMGLRQLILSNNEISIFYDDSFKNVDATVEYLDLAENEMTTVPVAFGTGHSWPKLIQLNLSDNYIGVISSGALSGMTALTHLNLENNPIYIISPGAWRGLSNIQALSLSPGGLEIGRIPTRNLENITSLTLSNGRPFKLKNIEPWLASFPKVQGFKLVRMGLTDDHFIGGSFPAAWKGNLKSLSLSDNLIKSTPWRLVKFGGNVSEELDLSYNFIDYITSYASFPSSLRKINVSHNRLERFSSKALLRLRNLESVDMSHNRLLGMAWNITQIDTTFEPGMTMYIGYNIWACVCGFPWFKILMHRQQVTRNGHLTLDEINNSIRCGYRGEHDGQLIRDVPVDVFQCPGVRADRWLMAMID